MWQWWIMVNVEDALHIAVATVQGRVNIHRFIEGLIIPRSDNKFLCHSIGLIIWKLFWWVFHEVGVR